MCGELDGLVFLGLWCACAHTRTRGGRGGGGGDVLGLLSGQQEVAMSVGLGSSGSGKFEPAQQGMPRSQA